MTCACSSFQGDRTIDNLPTAPEQKPDELLPLFRQIIGAASTAIATIRDTDWGPLSQYYAAFRLTNLLALNRKIQDRAEELGFDLEDARRVAPKVGFLWIDKASLEEDDDLQTMWANLMVSALNPNGADEIGDFELDTTFIEIASQFSPLDRQVLEYIVEHGRRPRATKTSNMVRGDGEPPSDTLSQTQSWKSFQIRQLISQLRNSST